LIHWGPFRGGRSGVGSRVDGTRVTRARVAVAVSVTLGVALICGRHGWSCRGCFSSIIHHRRSFVSLPLCYRGSCLLLAVCNVFGCMRRRDVRWDARGVETFLYEASIMFGCTRRLCCLVVLCETFILAAWGASSTVGFSVPLPVGVVACWCPWCWGYEVRVGLVVVSLMLMIRVDLVVELVSLSSLDSLTLFVMAAACAC